jgi:DNA primase
MAIEAGFDVKVPTFPSGKDPADVASEDPERFKAAIRTSQTAVEFFLDVLRPGAKDERTYKKDVEAQVLPLIAAMNSSIEQEHFARIVAARLGVSESAVQEEVAKRKRAPVYPAESAMPLSPPADEPLEPLEKKAAMLLFYFDDSSPEHARLVELLGGERIVELRERLMAEAEAWRFKFENELAEHSSEVIAKDMLAAISALVEKERFKMKFL